MKKNFIKEVNKDFFLNDKNDLEKSIFGKPKQNVYSHLKNQFNENVNFESSGIKENQKEMVKKYWAKEFRKAQNMPINFKNVKLPLARIKRLMKVEEDVKVIAQEVPVLFAFVTEKFIEELTLRAWLFTMEGKRKILQGSDIFKAVKTSKSFDFLHQIIMETEAAELKKQTE
ncbi:NFYC2 [Ecytonucleospora hepatopenaei]|uniref:NFYC2 n=1 Tax=Ecytonucleospora hepatopenaei TaxID=646526 RepID=A0A1W0E389_9MICR|nr:NFYC2 [Ecytonucleospora hepatopenaei]